MTSKNKIEIYKELHKELEDRKKKQVLYQQDHVLVEYDEVNEWIMADWLGYQSEETLKDGFTIISDAVKRFGTSKILNDNSHVLGIWTPAVQWLAGTYFPGLYKEGIKKFAWVNSPSALSRFSTEETLKEVNHMKMIKTFDSIEEAKTWLKSDQP